MNIPTRKTRPAVQAGRFYPASPAPLNRLVDRYLAEAHAGSLVHPKAVIAPHAGYSYSGPIAGSAFAPWAEESETIHRIVLLGPSHWVDFAGMALPDATALATPLGEVSLDLEAIGGLAGAEGLRVFDAAHAREHSLEVELPFLQAILRDFSIVPLVVGRATDVMVRSVVDHLWGGAETRFVLSSDLSHYLDYEAARKRDRETAEAIQDLKGELLTGDRACGYRVIRGFLGAAATRGFEVEGVDLRNSGDTGGSRDAVVGYGAFHATLAA